MVIRFASIIVALAALTGCGLLAPKERVVIKTVPLYVEVPTMPEAPSVLTSDLISTTVTFSDVGNTSIVVGLTADEVENLKLLLAELVGRTTAWKAWYDVNRATKHQ